ncbi:MAG: alanine:cation symporter family protein, partial [Cyclobacteriaceae bacterium]|jgi:AGCS family alanine or glycine:cation symporter
MADRYDENNDSDKEKMFKHIAGQESLELFTGELEVVDGHIMNDLTIIHARSFAEDIMVMKGKEPFNGKVQVTGGNIDDQLGVISLEGASLIHSAPLTTEAFANSFLGTYGRYIVSIGILLFAFSTAISWSYYGDRAVTFLFGSKYVIYYHIVYVIGFFVASFTDTTIIWTFSGITIALMTIPNLFGILLLHREMKDTVQKYWKDFKSEEGDNN